MSTKHIRTAADLVRFKRALKITCERCGNCQTVAAIDVVAIAGRQALETLRTRLKCSLCGARDARLSTLAPPEAQR